MVKILNYNKSHIIGLISDIEDQQIISDMIASGMDEVIERPLKSNVLSDKIDAVLAMINKLKEVQN